MSDRTIQDLQMYCGAELDRAETINAALSIIKTGSEILVGKSIDEKQVISDPYAFSVALLIAPYIGDKQFFREFNARLLEMFPQHGHQVLGGVKHDTKRAHGFSETSA